MGDLFLSDDVLSDDPRPRRSRPRWVDGLGLSALVLGIVAIGVLGDRGTPDRVPSPTTSTSTTAPARRGLTTASTTSTTEVPTTTTLVQQLGGDVTVTTDALVLIATGSTLTLVDVDAGTAKRVATSSGYGLVGLDEGFVLPVGTAFRLLPADGGTIVDLPLMGSTDERRLARAGPRTVWSVSGSGGDKTEGVELDTGGRPTGARFHLPADIYLIGVVDGGIIAGAHGGIVFVDGRTGRARSLGTGDVLAAGGRSVVRVACVVLKCRTEVVDVATGRSHAVPAGDPPVAGSARQAELSPDGRWLASSVTTSTGDQHVLVLDLRTGRSWTSDVIDDQAPIAFGPGSDVVFTTSSGSLCAFELATSTRSCLDGIQAGPASEIVAIRRPAG